MSLPGTTATPAADVLALGLRWSRGLAAGAVALCLLATGLTTGAHNSFVLVLVATGLIAGLPHGSIDHRLAAGLTGWPAPVVAGLYAAVAALTWVLLTTVGIVALVPVLVLSLVHFALGELQVIRDSTGWHPQKVVAAAVGVAGTGALLLPLARYGQQLADVAAAISPQLGGWLTISAARIGLAAFWVVSAAVAGVAALVARQYGVALDIVLIGALGTLAPPLVAFAVWFGGWHALRHCARLLLEDDASAALVANGQTRQAIKTLARSAAAPTIAAVVVLVGLTVLTTTAADPAAAVGSTLRVLLALTVPHMLVVLWLDRRPPRELIDGLRTKGLSSA